MSKAREGGFSCGLSGGSFLGKQLVGVAGWVSSVQPQQFVWIDAVALGGLHELVIACYFLDDSSLA